MVKIERVRWNDGSGNAVLDLQVSTVAELPALNEELGIRLKVCAGSIAHVIQAGAWYTLDDNGTWYDSDGNAAESANSNSLSASLSAPKNLGSIREEQPEITEESAVPDKIEKSVLYPEETAQTEPKQPDAKEGGEEDAELL